ncbi:hypothetical protein [Halorhodospira neutriphila]|uniref:Uncharacterized protein n=1 Tax=Halorhodospira neutriphila TaxID=168379 RepID=A0ABS1E184_9GAMM|nr:hypothetical protein [Halorhodospira neutriphila]MBK1725493.1 hypothetical protein [Halorhodospira neutriphila]
MDRFISASRLRGNIYAVIDWVLETGKPVELIYLGRRLRIVARPYPAADAPAPAATALPPADGAPEDFVHVHWDNEWRDAPLPGAETGRRPAVLTLYYVPAKERYPQAVWDRWGRRKKARPRRTAPRSPSALRWPPR